MNRFLYTLLTGLLLSGPAFAQVVSECDWRARAENIVEPWEDNTRVFANGDVRLAILDTIEPGAVPVNILVLSPPYDEMGGRQCRIISLGDGIGFSDATLEGMAAAYDPAIGLIFNIHVALYDPEGSTAIPTSIRVTLNQATGEIGASLQ